MKKKDMVLGYLLSIILILLLLTFLLSVMVISRMALSDFNPIGAHVISTRNLLSDISEVEKVAIPNRETIPFQEGIIQRHKYENFNITEINYLNINENKSFITLEFGSEIGKSEEGAYYIKITKNTRLQRGDLLVIEHNGLETLAQFVIKDEDGDFHLIESREEKIVEKNLSEIKGLVFMIR